MPIVYNLTRLEVHETVEDKTVLVTYVLVDILVIVIVGGAVLSP
jgi:hypothetical protein